MDSREDSVMDGVEGTSNVLIDQAEKLDRDAVVELIAKYNSMQQAVKLRQQAEEALLLSNRLLEQVFSAVPDALLVLDAAGACIRKFNVPAKEIFSQSSERLAELDFAALHLECDRGKLEQALTHDIDVSGYATYSAQLYRGTNQRFPGDIVLTPVLNLEGTREAIVAMVRDVGLQRKAEQALQQQLERMRAAQKMEAIGTLAGGVAHEFNNMLTPIMAFAELLQQEEFDSEKKSFLEHILRSTERARDLVQQMLAFSSTHKGRPKAVKVASLVEDTAKFIRQAISPVYELRVDCDVGEAMVFIDPVHLQQVFVNLVSNARDAISATGGEIVIAVRSHRGRISGWENQPRLPTDRYLCFAVCDNGCGMDPEDVERMFDPFFTTKDVGAGTGMGLSVVHGIAKHYNGMVTVESQRGKGTTVYFYLPVYVEPELSQPVPAPGVPKGNRETVMYVDDDPTVATTVGDILESLGYEAVIYTDCREALAAFTADPERFDVVLTDYLMPHMTGLELASSILDARPQLPVLLISGYSQAITKEMVHALGIHGLVRKPFNRQELAHLLADMLHRDLSTAG